MDFNGGGRAAGLKAGTRNRPTLSSISQMCGIGVAESWGKRGAWISLFRRGGVG